MAGVVFQQHFMKIWSQFWVCILDRFWGHSGLPFGSFLESFLGTLGALWAIFGRLGGAWG